MKRTIFLFSIFSLLFSCKEESIKILNMNVRFDGVYESKHDGEGYGANYLRFYKNGKVLEVSTTDDPQESAEYLIPANSGNGYVTEGSYQIESDKISFTTSDKECSI